MTLDEAIKHEEEMADGHDRKKANRGCDYRGM